MEPVNILIVLTVYSYEKKLNVIIATYIFIIYAGDWTVSRDCVIK